MARTAATDAVGAVREEIPEGKEPVVFRGGRHGAARWLQVRRTVERRGTDNGDVG